MILARFFRQKSGDQAVELAYAAIMTAARRPVLYEDFEVADTLDGRFDMLALHAFSLMERLKAGDGAAKEFAQRLADRIFLEMDRALREMGVGDLSVAKRVRKLAEVFYGRLSAYTRAAERGEPLMAQALQRNVYPDGVSPAALAGLTNYVMILRQSLASQAPAALAMGSVDFPEIPR